MSESLSIQPPTPEDIFSHEADQADIISFEDYRQLCDATDGFRRVGIQDEESYQAILEDERTVFFDYEKQRVPLVASLEHEKMYDDERCLLLSGKKNAMLLAVPVSLLDDMPLGELYEIDKDTIIMIEEFVPTDESTKLDEHDLSGLPFANAKPFDFKHPDLSHLPQHETAWMAGYRFNMQPRNESPRPYEGEHFLAGEVMQGWQKLCTEQDRPLLPEGDSVTGTFILSAEQLAERPDIAEQLWEISQIGFGKILGAHHPISMEFNKLFFDNQIAADNTVTSVVYKDGRIDCFGFIGLDLKNNEWNNVDSTVMQDETAKAEMNQEAFIHFHELIGRGQKGMGHAKEILRAVLDAAAETKYRFSVFLESTNLSSLYVLGLTERALDRSETMTQVGEIDILGKLSYWGLVAKEDVEDVAPSDSYQAA